MTLTLDRTWAVLIAVAVLACLAVYWQASEIERRPKVLPEDLGLQFEDVTVGLGDEGYLPRP